MPIANVDAGIWRGSHRKTSGNPDAVMADDYDFASARVYFDAVGRFAVLA